jgi:hypothetical protein
MGRLDIRDVPRDEDSADDPVTSGDEQGADRPLAESQMTVWDCIADAEQRDARTAVESYWREDKLEPVFGNVSARTLGGWIKVDGCHPGVGDRIMIVGSQSA